MGRTIIVKKRLLLLGMHMPKCICEFTYIVHCSWNFHVLQEQTRCWQNQLTVQMLLYISLCHLILLCTLLTNCRDTVLMLTASTRQVDLFLETSALFWHKNKEVTREMELTEHARRMEGMRNAREVTEDCLEDLAVDSFIHSFVHSVVCLTTGP